jgi:hypothetical protein
LNAAVVFDNLPTAEQQPMMLQGQDSGGVQVELTYVERTNSAPTAASNRRLTVLPSQGAAASFCQVFERLARLHCLMLFKAAVGCAAGDSADYNYSKTSCQNHT